MYAPFVHVYITDTFVAPQMPKGVPVATVAIGNAANAGLLALRILAGSDTALQQRMLDYQVHTSHPLYLGLVINGNKQEEVQLAALAVLHCKLIIVLVGIERA